MFADWTDPYDIDHYYADVGKIFTKVSAYADPSPQVVTPAPVVAVPTQVDMTSVSAASTTVAAPAAVVTPVKSEFEVVPNSIFLDGHSVGSQPPYNILRSGPPSKDTYMNRYVGGQGAYMYGVDQDINSNKYCSWSDPWMIFLWIIIAILFVNVIKLNIMVCSNQMMIHSLMQTLGKKM